MANTIINGGASPYPKGASGSIITITDGADNAPLKSAIVNIEPVQDLHGYDYPWPGGGGVNKFDSEATTLNGFTRLGDTFTNSQADTRSEPQILIQAFNGNTYLGQSGTFVNKGDGRYGNYYAVPSGTTRLRIKHNGQTKDLTIDFDWSTVATIYGSLEIVSWNPTTVGGFVVRNIMIALTETYSPYSPYSNICPISGWTQVNGYADGVNLISTDILINGYHYNVSGILESHAIRISTPKIKCVSRDSIAISWESDVSQTQAIRCIWDENGNLLDRAVPLATIEDNRRGYVTNLSQFSGAFYIGFSFYASSSVVGHIDRPMIAFGSSLATYTAPTITPITIPLGRTVYGGTLDAVRGKMTLTHAYYQVTTANLTNASYVAAASSATTYYYNLANVLPSSSPGPSRLGDNEAWSNKYLPYDNLYSNRAVEGFTIGGRYVSLRVDASHVADTTGASLASYLGTIDIVYPLATPIEVDLSPQTIKTLLGVNNIWADAGEMSIEYYPAAASIVAVQNRTTKMYVSIPLGMIRYETYQITPQQTIDLDSYRSENGNLLRNPVATKCKLEFNTPLMTDTQWGEIWNIIKAGFNNNTERKLKLKYYDTLSATYKTGYFYVPDVQTTIRNINEGAGVINYNEIRIAFIEY